METFRHEVMFSRHYRRSIPQRPAAPESFPKDDERHWYDEEYAGWGVVKKPLPKSPGKGSEGRRLAFFCPGKHPYWQEYVKGLHGEARQHGFLVDVHYAEWDQEVQTRAVMEAVENPPDIIILAPAEVAGGTECIRYAYERGVPVIASNQVLEPEAYRMILSWTGPDDWGQHRLLARHFASIMDKEGGYCLVTHHPGTSTYLARCWAVITELNKIAPHLTLLDMKFTGFNRELTRRTVLDWIDTYQDRLKGIISADDALPQEGINRAVAQRGREDIIRAANGATRRGLGFVLQGTLAAQTWQSPELDGALPVKVAADWLRGLRIKPIEYLPMSIITRENVNRFLEEGRGFEDFHGEDLCRMILEGRFDEIRGFFEDLQVRLENERVVGEEYFNGFSIELVSDMINLAKTKGINPVELVGGYEMLYKGLFHQDSASKSLEWVHGFAKAIVESLMEASMLTGSIVDRLLAYVELNYRSPIALKMLSCHFGLSAAYLGKVFKEEMGIPFSTYLNEFRIEKAKELLASGAMKAKEVADAVGYSEANYFYAIFKKYTGHSPTDYCRSSP